MANTLLVNTRNGSAAMAKIAGIVAVRNQRTHAAPTSRAEQPPVYISRPDHNAGTLFFSDEAPAIADVENNLNPFVDFARSKGVDHVVFLSVEGAALPVWVIPTDEEREIAQSTHEQVRGRARRAAN